MRNANADVFMQAENDRLGGFAFLCPAIETAVEMMISERENRHAASYVLLDLR